MADGPFIFVKTREQRLEELKDVLCPVPDVSLPALDVADMWSYTLENFIEPTGWQALWKISRKICEELNITFPKYVVVKVLSVNFHELTAFVEVEEVQENMNIPVKQEVPLVQLFPLRQQEDQLLNIDYTANFIDQLRFFYNQIWCPWDVEDGNEDWPSKYLEPRLQLVFEMSDGTVPAKLADVMHRKKEEAKALFEARQELEELLLKSSKGEVNAEDISSPEAENQTYEIMQLHLRLNPLITELQMFENPSMRKLVIKRFLEDEEKKQENCSAIVVWQSGLLEGFTNFLQICKEVLDAGTVTVSAPSLESAMESAVSGNTILLYEGAHEINRCLELDLSMLGVGNNLPEIVSKKGNSFLLNVRKANIKFKNLKLNARMVSNALQVLNNATVELINCEISGAGLMAGRGILANTGSTIILKGCTFSELYVAVNCHPGSKVHIQDSKFENCVYGIEAFENSDLHMTGGSVVNCKEAGLLILQSSGSNEKGSIRILEKFKKFNLSQVQLSGNTLDVVLKRLPNSVRTV